MTETAEMLAENTLALQQNTLYEGGGKTRGTDIYIQRRFSFLVNEILNE